LLLIVLHFSVGLVAGCGKSSSAVAHLTGEVMLDGKPLPEGASASVTFRPTGQVGQPVSAEIVQSRYDCPGVPHGDVLAVISISLPTGRTLQGDLRSGESGREFESVMLSADQASGIKLGVAGDANVNLELNRAKK
jgi:hypothetical protein